MHSPTTSGMLWHLSPTGNSRSTFDAVMSAARGSGHYIVRIIGERLHTKAQCWNYLNPTDQGRRTSAFTVV